MSIGPIAEQNSRRAETLVAMRHTIAELKRQIGELEAQHSEELSAITEQHIADCRELWAKIDAATQALTAERQRRGALETVAKLALGLPAAFTQCRDAAEAYFAELSSTESDNRTKVAG